MPEEVGFRTKPQLARIMLERALDAGVPAAWVTADEAYGGDPALRRWLEARGVSYALAVKRTELLATTGPDGPVRASAEQLAADVPAEQWVTASAGHGAKGRRLYDWTRVDLAAAAGVGAARWLLVRRWPGWYRYITLALRAPRLSGRHPRPGHQRPGNKGGRRSLTVGLGLVPLTVPKVRRLLVALVWTAPTEPGLVLGWSRWRRRHQARARRAHYQRQRLQLRLG